MEKSEAVCLLKGLGFQVKNLGLPSGLVYVYRAGSYSVSELNSVPTEGFHGWHYERAKDESGTVGPFNRFFYLSKEEAERDFLNGRGFIMGKTSDWVPLFPGEVDDFVRWVGFEGDSLDGVGEMGQVLWGPSQSFL